MKKIFVFLTILGFVSLTLAKDITSKDKKYPNRKVASQGQVPDCAKEALVNDTVHLGYLISYDLVGKSSNDVAKFIDVANGDRLFPKSLVPIPRGASIYTELHVDIPLVAHESLKKIFLNSLAQLARLEGVAIHCDLEGKE